MVDETPEKVLSKLTLVELREARRKAIKLIDTTKEALGYIDIAILQKLSQQATEDARHI